MRLAGDIKILGLVSAETHFCVGNDMRTLCVPCVIHLQVYIYAGAASAEGYRA